MSVAESKNPLDLFAQFDTGMAYADGLFQTRMRNRTRQRGFVSVVFSGVTVEFRAFEQLDVFDQTLLLHLIRLAGMDSMELTPSSASEASVALRKALGPDSDGGPASPYRGSAVIRTTIWALCQAVSDGKRDDGGARGLYRAVRASLTRLGNVTMTVRLPDPTRWWAQWPLLASVVVDPEDRVWIGLNPRVAQAMVAGPRTRIDLAERALLQSDEARLAHVWLSAWLSPGETRAIGLNSLAQHVWPVAATGSTLRMRRTRLRRALAEIGKLAGWRVMLSGSTCQIQRAQLPLQR